MDATSELLAGRYARALLNYTECPFDEQFLVRLNGFCMFLTREQTRLVGVTKKKLVSIIEIFHLEKTRFDLLLELLKRDKALALFIEIVKKFFVFYKEQYGILVCSIKSSHELSVYEKEELSRCIGKITGKRIFYTYELDKSLIAGVRIEGETILLEDSISQRLRAVEQLH